MFEKELDDDLNIALEASKGAGDIIMKYYKHDYEIKEKGYHNPVTTADNEADDFLKKTLLIALQSFSKSINLFLILIFDINLSLFK